MASAFHDWRQHDRGGMFFMIPPEDLKIESAGWESPGGQHVGVPRGVKITHLPTETVAISRSARSAFKNRKIAMDMILAAITHPDCE